MPKGPRNPESSYAKLVEIAESKGGKVISTEYLGIFVKMEFEDSSGNRFWMRPNHIKQGHWSPYETKSMHNPERSMERLQEAAAAKSGRIVSTSYVDIRTKIECEDAAGNRFWMWPSHILKGHWSPYEAKVVRDPEFHLAELREIAKSRGGKLISTNYVNWKTLLEFEDAAGNRFWSNSNNIKRGQWSPHEGLVSEPVCRQAMEHLFGRAFPSRWDVVKRPNGNKLQLDGFNEDLRVAFEYQGFWHGQAHVQARDEDKRAACRAVSILLIAVEPFEPKHKYAAAYVLEHVASAVREAYSAAGRIPPALNFDGLTVDLMRINHCIRQHEIVAKLAEERGGKLLSKEYVNDLTKLEFEDGANNTFWLSPGALKQGKWSPYESNHVQDPEYHYAEMVRISALRGGKVISTVYEGWNTKMEFEDASGNRFRAVPNSIKGGSWSPYEFKQAQVSVQVEDATRHVFLHSGAEVVYDILEDQSLRIREARSSDCLVLRKWNWDDENNATITRLERLDPEVDFPNTDEEAPAPGFR